MYVSRVSVSVNGLGFEWKDSRLPPVKDKTDSFKVRQRIISFE